MPVTPCPSESPSLNTDISLDVSLVLLLTFHINTRMALSSAINKHVSVFQSETGFVVGDIPAMLGDVYVYSGTP
jgi:hypothetical protein